MLDPDKSKKLLFQLVVKSIIMTKKLNFDFY